MRFKKSRIVSLMAVAFLATGSVRAAPSPYQLPDDGITTPFMASPASVEYIKNLNPELQATLRAKPEMVEAWQDMKFGFFIHWDPSCQVTGSMSWNRNGRRPHHSSDLEPKKGTDSKVYNSQYKTFNPTEFNAEEWVLLAKEAGCRYMVFTAKHHNGFCMFDSAVTDYDIMSTPFKRDVCAELAAACHKYNMKLEWYYSQPDWTEKRYRAEYPSAEWNLYLNEFLYPQLRELYTQYGQIDGIWWDGLGKGPDWWHSAKMLNMLRAINPNLISNHRCAPRDWRWGDYDGPENEVGRFQINRPWESCMRMGGAWGYTKGAAPLSLPDAMSLLIRCAGNGGNLLLNTGPSPAGTITESHAQRYREMGAWLRQYGESIYATRGGPYTPGPWGCATRSKEGNIVYLHILGHWNGSLSLPNLPAKVVSARCLTGGKVAVQQFGGKLNVTASQIHEFDTIIALELDCPAHKLPVVESVGASLTIGAKATASSEGTSSGKPAPASNVVASDATEFDQGDYVRGVWRPEMGKDDAPWLQITFDGIKTVRQIYIQEGKVGQASTVQAFTISARSGNDWKVVYEGTSIGNNCGIVLSKPVETDALRLDFQKFDQHVTLNLVNAY